MKIDKNLVDRLCAMNDEKLWGTIRLFASTKGVSLSGKRVTSRDIAKLRAALLSLTESDIKRICEIMDIYKYGGTNGR